MRIVLLRSRATDFATIDKWASTLSRGGHDVHVVLWDRQDILTRTDNYPYRITRFVFRVPQDQISGMFFLPIWWFFAFQFILRRKPDIVHAIDLDTLLVAVAVRLISTSIIAYAIHDFYANNIPVYRLGFFGRILRTLFAEIESDLLRFTSAVFLMDEKRVNEIKRAPAQGYVFVYNSPPDMLQHLRAQVDFSPPHSQTSALKVFYCGLIHSNRGLEHIMEAVSQMEGVELQIAGIGPDTQIVQEYERRCAKISYIGWIETYEDVMRLTYWSDVLFRFSNPNIPKTAFESPNKIFEAMMCMKPVIVSSGSGMSDIVEKEKCGIIVPYGDLAAIRSSLIALRDSPELRSRLGANGRRAYEEKYSWSIMERRIIETYCKLERTSKREVAKK